MNSNYYLIFIICSGLVLSACSDDDNGRARSEPENTLAVVGGQAADDAPLAISIQLENDIQAVFGGADNSPTDVITGDTVQTVINRAISN